MTSPDPFAAVAALGLRSPRAAATAPVRPAVPLPQAVKGWRENSVAWIRTDDPDAASVLAARTPPTEPPRLVIVGETNRGKSSLVNGLLGVSGLSPVDAGTATSVYLVFRHSAQPYSVARFGGGLADVTFPAADLRRWATVDGDPDVDLPPPRWIEVGVPVELTKRVTLVDTPGVGGLVAAHGELAAEAAAAAAALLFVVDASAPFTRGELDFLAAIGDRVDTVHFAVTKTDAYRGWREIVDADRQLLARYAPRFSGAEFHPVSSRLMEASLGQSNPQVASVLADQSGIPKLRKFLVDEVAAASAMLFDANIIRSTMTVVQGAVQQLENSRRAFTAGAAQADQLKARREELMNQRKTGGRSFQVGLRAEIQRARVDLSHETSREVREASQMFRGAIDQADNEELKNLPLHINAYVQAMTQRGHARLVDSMGRICQTVLSELFTPEELRVLVGRLSTRPYEAMSARALERAQNVDDRIMALSGASLGFSLSHTVLTLPTTLGLSLAAAPILGIVLAPVTAVVGGAAAIYMMRSRKRMATRQQMKQWLMEMLNEAKAQVDQSVAEQFVDADEQLTLALDDALGKQVAALEAEIREVDGALKLDATERASRMRALDERRASAQTILSAGESLLQRIRNTKAITAGPAQAGLDAIRAAARAGSALAPAPEAVPVAVAAGPGGPVAPPPGRPATPRPGGPPPGGPALRPPLAVPAGRPLIRPPAPGDRTRPPVNVAGVLRAMMPAGVLPTGAAPVGSAGPAWVPGGALAPAPAATPPATPASVPSAPPAPAPRAAPPLAATPPPAAPPVPPGGPRSIKVPAALQELLMRRAAGSVPPPGPGDAPDSRPPVPPHRPGRHAAREDD